MKKTYIAPALDVQLLQLEGLIALSLQSGNADNSDALVKGNNGEDIWGSSSENFWDGSSSD